MSSAQVPSRCRHGALICAYGHDEAAPAVRQGLPRQKKKRAQGPLSPCDPGQGRNTLQPVAAVGGVFDDGVRLHERNQDAVAARLEEARREEHRIRLGSYGDHAACDEERHRHQEQVKRRGWQAQARNAAGNGRGWHEARQA